ncbi:MAG: alpha/beta hydrolase [Clostridia bacterium]|nr:alpha/beta hydrolase [Clostridia bacterium]
MIYRSITLEPYTATLTALCVTNDVGLKQTPRRAVLVCPGGGYGGLALREAEPIATQFLAAGYATFILYYTTKAGAANYQPLKQAALAIRHIREHAEEYNVDPRFVFTCGFSAGGHLAASAGVLWDSPVLDEVTDGAPRDIARPTGMILGYPVITAGEYTHKGSIRNLCGKKEYTEEEADRFSLEKHVSPTTPPAFLWHTFTDELVPVQNALLFSEAMTAAGVPFEMHIFPAGVHGLALATEQTLACNPDWLVPHAAIWVELALRWLETFD